MRLHVRAEKTAMGSSQLLRVLGLALLLLLGLAPGSHATAQDSDSPQWVGGPGSANFELAARFAPYKISDALVHDITSIQILAQLMNCHSGHLWFQHIARPEVCRNTPVPWRQSPMTVPLLSNYAVQCFFAQFVAAIREQ